MNSLGNLSFFFLYYYVEFIFYIILKHLIVLTSSPLDKLVK